MRRHFLVGILFIAPLGLSASNGVAAMDHGMKLDFQIKGEEVSLLIKNQTDEAMLVNMRFVIGDVGGPLNELGLEIKDEQGKAAPMTAIYKATLAEKDDFIVLRPGKVVGFAYSAEDFKRMIRSMFSLKKGRYSITAVYQNKTVPPPVSVPGKPLFQGKLISNTIMVDFNDD